MALDAQQLIDEARATTRLSEFGDFPLFEPLSQFCASLNTESGMDAEHLALAGRGFVATLVERLKIEDWLRRHPEILRQQLAQPVNIIGLARSGTTALQQFLSEDPDMRSIRRWELGTPTPPPDDAVGDADPRIAETRAAFEERDRRFPNYRAMLPVAAEDCSEHNTPMNLTFMNLQMLTLYDAPSYTAWMLAADLTPAYRYLERYLKLLQWKTPRARWNLKNPKDLFVLPAFMNAFPNAKVAWLHRDPVSTVGSACSLISTVREGMAPVQDKARYGRFMLDFLSESVRRAMRDRDAHGLPIVDIYNRDVARDPVASIADLYGKLGIEFTAAFEGRLKDRIANRPRGQFGRHSYALEDFGLTAGEVRERFRTYTDRFQVPLEH